MGLRADMLLRYELSKAFPTLYVLYYILGSLEHKNKILRTADPNAAVRARTIRTCVRVFMMSVQPKK